MMMTIMNDLGHAPSEPRPPCRRTGRGSRRAARGRCAATCPSRRLAGDDHAQRHLVEIYLPLRPAAALEDLSRISSATAAGIGRRAGTVRPPNASATQLAQIADLTQA